MLRKRLLFVAMVLAVTGAWCWLSQIGFVQNLENRTQDRLQFARTPSADIVLVTIDNESIQELGVWPWGRGMHGQIIENLTSAGANVIGYDVTFSEASQPAADERLKTAIDNSDRVILASESVLEIRGNDLPLEVSELRPIFGDATSYGPTTLVPDADGVVRRVPQEVQRGEQVTYQTFAGLIVHAFKPAVTVHGGLLRVPFVGGPETFESVSAASVYQNTFDPATVRGKIVLVGATASDLHDEYLTPASHGQAMSGVEIQANVIQALLEGESLRLSSTLAELAILIGLALLLLICGLTFKLRYMLVTALVISVGYVVTVVAVSGNGLLLPVVYPLSLIVAIVVLDIAYRYRDESGRRLFIQQAFGRYVSPTVVDKLVKGEAALELGGHKEELTILFSDIRGFTTLSEKMAPEDLVHFLNEYLTGMTGAVLDQEGTVDKYIGDAVMAFWGAPLPQSDHAIRAVETALTMRTRLAKLNARWAAQGRPTIDIGIGLNTGRVIVGNMGSEKRFDYTVIGDDVNLASRLESLTKFYGVGILVSEATLRELNGRYLTRPLDKVAVKGKKDAVKIFEVIVELEQATPEQIKLVKKFEAALQAYYARDWEVAKKLFSHFSSDKTAQHLMERCDKYSIDDPGTDWDGTYVAKEK